MCRTGEVSVWVGGRLACRERDEVMVGSVLRRIAGGRSTFLRFAIKLQKKNAAVLRSLVRSSVGSGSTRKKSNVVGSLLPLSPSLYAANSLQTIIRPLNRARDNNSTSKGVLPLPPLPSPTAPRV